MPVKNGVGFSEYTSVKQEVFTKFLDLQLRIARGAIRNNKFRNTDRVFYYFDLNAGPGIVDNRNGSPMIFIDSVKELQMSFKAFLIEKEKSNYHQLVENLQVYNGRRIFGKVYPLCGDHCEVMSGCAAKIKNDMTKYGLIYTDPSGGIPPFKLLENISKLKDFKRVDMLIHCPSVTIKRCFKRNGSERLEEFLEPIEKKHWLISEPHGPHAWTFLFGCNWTKFPDFAQIGFHKLFESKKGKNIFTRLNYTKEELSNYHQLSLIP